MNRPRCVNLDDVDWVSRDAGPPLRRAPIASAAGASMIGCSAYELPPGSTSWPYHFHCANEEAVFVLAGRGTVRHPEGELTLRPGDYVAFPRGRDGAHQIVNDADEPLRYLCISTMVEPDVTVYPDSRKVGIFAGSAPGGSEHERYLSCFLDADAVVDYWNDED